MWRAFVILGLMVLVGCSGATTVESTVMDQSEPWDLVWFSDSTGWGVADLWAERIEQELGVEVRVRDRSEGGLAATRVLDSINNEGSEVPNWIAEAEVVVVFGNPRGSGATDDMETCVSTSTAPRDPPENYSAEHWEPYQEVLTAIYDRIFDLRGDQPTIVRAIDMYNPVIADWREAGIDEACTSAWEVFAQAISEAAAQKGVATGSMFDAFNGPDHNKDPREQGLIGPDGQHTTDEGKAVMVDVLHALGYGPVNP